MWDTCSINALYCKFKSDLKSQRRNLIIVDCNLFGYCFCSSVPYVQFGGDSSGAAPGCHGGKGGGHLWLRAVRPGCGQSKGLCGSGPACPWEKGEQGSCPCSPCGGTWLDGSLWMHRIAMHPFIQALSCFTGLDSGRSLALPFSHSVFHSEFSFGYFKASKIWLEFGNGPGETPGYQLSAQLCAAWAWPVPHEPESARELGFCSH